MDGALTLPAPAKLNLFLHITGRRADGYHDLQTAFQLLDHGDLLRFAPASGGDIELTTDLPGLAAEDNLVYRAAHALRDRAGANQGARIHLSKRLPAGGGLGGGSSDAATTLLALNRLWNLNWSLDELAALGLELGADVPVFVHGRSAWAEGVGERLTPLTLPGTWYLVICPDCRVETAGVFGDRQLTRNESPITIRAFLEGGGHNSCQPVVEALYPPVREARNWLEQFAPARLTGTGACLFARFASESSARKILARLPGRWEGFVARGVNVSPAHRALTTSL